MKNLICVLLLFLSWLSFSQDYDSYLKEANNALESGKRFKALELSKKALELNPTSSDAKWVRLRALFTEHASDDDLQKIIIDLNFILANGKPTERVYNALGKVENALGKSIMRWKKTKADFEDALLHFKVSKSAYNKAIELQPELISELSYDLKELDLSITQTTQRINVAQ